MAAGGRRRGTSGNAPGRAGRVSRSAAGILADAILVLERRPERGGTAAQIGDFEAHGVYGFVIHPRIGLPRDIGWMSPKMLRLMKLAVEEARRRKMYVILYDEGMYPSGSASGQVWRTIRPTPNACGTKSTWSRARSCG